jgi:type I restriction enzyme S subunit
MSFVVNVDDIVAENRSGLLAIHPSWCRIRLGDCATVQNGFAFSSKEFAPGQGVPLIRIRDIRSNQTETSYNGEYDDSFLVGQGDLLVGMDGDFNCALWNGPDGLLNQRVCRVTEKTEGYDKRFLFHVLQPYLTAVNNGTSAMTVKHLSSITIREIQLPLPPLNEQRRIVAKIEELFSDLDAGVAALERVRANLKRYRAAVLKAAVEGKLTEQWRAEHPATEPAPALLKRILHERRRRWQQDQRARFTAAGREPPKGWQGKYVEPAGPELDGLPALPKGWCWTSIGQCFAVHVGATPSRKEADYWGGDIPWVSSGQVQFCHIKQGAEQITRKGLENTSTRLNPAGSVLLGMIGEGRTRGQTAILDMAACNNQNCAAIWVPQTPIPSEYVFCWLRSQYEATRRASSGNNQPALNRARVEQIVMPLPPLNEQRQIVVEIEELLSVVDVVEIQVAANLRRAARLRQSILKQAFEGKLVPQDPADEPAAKLLERIAADRRPPGSLASDAKLGHNSRRKRKSGTKPASAAPKRAAPEGPT